MNKDHLHNHIIINAYMPDGLSKFCLTAEKRMEIRELSDEIQHEYGIELKFADPRSPRQKGMVLIGSGLPGSKIFPGKRK